MKPDISVIILTKDEEIHLERCINSVKPIAREIYIVDSYSSDRTLEIAENLGAYVLQNKWENNYAKQFNWGLDNLPISTQWVLRLDADEYLTNDLICEIQEKLEYLSPNVTGVILKRRVIFLGKWIKRAVYPVRLLRLFRFQIGRCEQKFMDEHIQLLQGETVEFECDFIDENLNNISWWAHKHVNYAIREAVDLLDIEYNISGMLDNDTQKELGPQAKTKRKLKHSYQKLPLFFRAFFYFCYIYFYKLEFLEGKIGFIYCFLQCWWYRTFVDVKLYEIKQHCGNDKGKICSYLKSTYGIDFDKFN